MVYHVSNIRPTTKSNQNLASVKPNLDFVYVHSMLDSDPCESIINLVLCKCHLSTYTHRPFLILGWHDFHDTCKHRRCEVVGTIHFQRSVLIISLRDENSLSRTLRLLWQDVWLILQEKQPQEISIRVSVSVSSLFKPIPHPSPTPSTSPHP